MLFLTLNCQRGFQPELKSFLEGTLKREIYDVLVLQEVTETVLASLSHHAYQFARVMSEELGRESELCVVYKKSFQLLHTGFKSFGSLRKDPEWGLKHPTFGILWVDLEVHGRPLRMTSVHTHSGIHSRIRLEETRWVKETLLLEATMPTFIMGDFNTGFPGEPLKVAEVLAPEFVWFTEKLGPTLDSRYTENVAHLSNRIAALLSLARIGIRLRTDHIFIDRCAAETYRCTCRVLSDRVSDHLPVECRVSLI